jgi:hypothetical protein
MGAPMTAEGWRGAVLQAATDPESLELLVPLLDTVDELIAAWRACG